ncbi:ATP-binding cassette domain-containing protein [bacterium]|nr:ATP-binding cassette domain-containing protein [bacterium]
MSLKAVLFSQAAGLISIGKNRVIQAEDHLPLMSDLNPKDIPWDESKVVWTDKKSFLISLLKVSRKNFFKAISFQVLGSAFSFATPFLVHSFITRLQAGNFSENDLLQLCMIALGFGLCGAGNGIAIQHYFFQTLKFNQIAINLVNKKIFSHSLKLSANAKNKYQVGDIVNYMSSDSDAIADGAITTIDLSNAVVLSIGCTVTLFYFLGWSALVAVIVMALLIPMTSYLSKSFMHLEDEMMSHRDRRMTLMTQLLSAIRVVKYFVWEKSVLQEVAEVRAKEINARYRLAQAEISWGLIYTSITSIVLFTALLTHTLRGLPVDIALIFTCISIFGLMEDQFGGLSRFIGRFINIIVSADRITKFVQSDTVQIKHDKKHTEAAIEMKDVNFFYDSNQNLIKNLNLSVKKGASLAVVGPVGSGKTTLLNLLLDEVQPISGQVLFGADRISRAYVPQDAYIINASLRENIIFGQENVTEDDIKKALKLSALEYDLLAWPSGLDTEIGEKGVNLSGGQKQRVSLARAIIAKAELILLDDPLSAVDPSTENYLCEHLIFGEWKNKTRVVVTHRLASVNRFDHILFVEEGEHFIGTYDELMSSCASFKRFLKTHEANLETEKNSGIKSQQHEVSQAGAVGDSSRIMQDEDRAIGAVEKSVYFNYLKALGGKPPKQNKILTLLFIGAISVIAAPLLQKIWLSQSDKMTGLTPVQIILIYGGLGFLTMLLVFLSNSFWSRRGIEAGKSFHDQMLRAILSAPIRFFDSTPVGRILQRFSRDMESVDIHLQWSFDNTIHSVFHITMSFILIVAILPLVLIFILPIFFVYYNLQNSYRRVAREIKRLDSMARSPRFAHFKETLHGLPVIRAFNQSEWSMNQFYSKLTYSTQMFHTHYMVNRWFSTRLPLIGACISASTGLMVVFSSYHGYIAAGTAGLVTIYALDFWRHLNWGVRIFSDLESRMTSVERLQFYCDLPAEKNYLGEPLQLEESWPQSGDLEFKNVSLRYADHLPLVLKNVSFKVKSGARVGLIGRTGSGKSTIFQSVYRFVDIVSGEILLDNKSIHQIPLKRVRKNLAVIPQDPALFMGTLRSNIDRYNQVSDEEVWEVLKKVSLDEFVKELPGQLEFKVAENGANMSQGQRQLICLARALLMKVKIIFLDEATASVDVETDALVQKVIRESLQGMTLITIAHRLSTLDGYDMIIELNNGEIV